MARSYRPGHQTCVAHVDQARTVHAFGVSGLCLQRLLKLAEIDEAVRPDVNRTKSAQLRESAAVTGPAKPARWLNLPAGQRWPEANPDANMCAKFCPFRDISVTIASGPVGDFARLLTDEAAVTPATPSGTQVLTDQSMHAANYRSSVALTLGVRSSAGDLPTLEEMCNARIASRRRNPTHRFLRA